MNISNISLIFKGIIDILDIYYMEYILKNLDKTRFRPKFA